MIKLHDDIAVLNAQLSGIRVFAREKEYVFGYFYLDAERDPPVATGFVLHPRLYASVWRWEEITLSDGKKKKVQAKYGYRPHELDFALSKIEGANS